MNRETLITNRTKYRRLLIVGNLILGYLAILIGIHIEWGMGNILHGFRAGWWQYLLLPWIWVVSLGFYNQFELHPRIVEVSSVLRNAWAALIGTLVFTAFIYMVNRGFGASRMVFFFATAIASVFFTANHRLILCLSPKKLWRERHLLLGRDASSSKFVKTPGLHVIEAQFADFSGLLVSNKGMAAPENQLPCLGHFEDLEAVVEEYAITNVTVCPDVERNLILAQTTSHAARLGLVVEYLESTYERLTGRSPVMLAGTDWGQSLESVRHDTYIIKFKHLVDVLVAVIFLPLALILIGIGALLIKIFSPGPVFYHQKRVGKDGREFNFTKIRTMIINAEGDTGAVWATENDPRITPVGRVLRKLRFDELPQLFSVIKGDMSIVGPRPERPEFVNDFIQKIPFYEKRLLVRPGITGWAQINHHYDKSLEDVVEKLRYDLYYVRNVSLLFDLQIIWRTFGVMLFGKGAQ